MRVKVFHGSRFEFEKINIYESIDIGFHCGTLNQAIARVADDIYYSSTLFQNFIYEVNIDVNNSNTITLDDCIQWCDIKILKKNLGIAGFDSSECKSLEEIRKKLISNGYEYIRYKNEVEGNGYSYILLSDNHKIKKHKIGDLFYRINNLLQTYEIIE